MAPTHFSTIFKSCRSPTFYHLQQRRLKHSVRIYEMAARDGLQNETKSLPANIKLELIKKLVDVGCRHVEVGSFVSPKWVPQMATTTEMVQSLTLESLRLQFPSPNLTMSCLVPNMKGIQTLETILTSSSNQVRVIDEVALFVSATEAFSTSNLNTSIQESLDNMSKVSLRAQQLGLRVRGYVSCIVGCPFSGNVNSNQVANVTRKLIEMGCYEVSIADTVGVGTPTSIQNVINTCIQKGIRVDQLAIHCHDTFGSGIANMLAAVEMGVKTVDSSVGGIGGCPYSPGATGNVATEDVVYALESSGYSTSLLGPQLGQPVANDHERLARLEPLSETGQWINDQLGRPNSSRVGKATLARRLRRQAQAKSPVAKL